jgi:hypothetical protein
MTSRLRLDSAWSAAALYAIAAVLMTWPLATVLHREIAWDLGDPLFNAWVLMWTGGQVLQLFSGDWTALHRYWHGNIFWPEPLTIAYSEHLTPEMLQALPVWAATGNIVLAYNLLFLSTFVLSGLGMYLLVRDLTGRPSAAFLAGLAFAFTPYRISQYSHLQVLSSQWMPFALLGVRRFFESERIGALVGGSAALVAQVLSCGYYLLFFTPFLAAYGCFEMTMRRLWRSARTWRLVALAAVLSALVVWPFAARYLDVRAGGDVGVRGFEETARFSADVYALLTSSDFSRVWGSLLRPYPQPEGEGFLGLVTMGLAVVGLGAAVVRGRSHWALPVFLAAAVGLSAALALGPQVRVAGEYVGAGPYRWLMDAVPLFNAVRVPARFLMVTACFLAVLAGLGAAWLLPRFRPVTSGVLAAGLGLAILAESFVGRFPTNVRLAPVGFELTARHLSQPDEMSPLYRIVRDDPGEIVLIEFPFGEPAYEMMATFYAGYHRRPLVNGFSGFFPEPYLRRSTFLSGIPFDLDAATRALRSSGATHALVHEGAFSGGRGVEVTEWLRSIGGHEVASHGRDRLLVLR